MPHFTTTDSLRFRSFLVAHGVDASTAEKVAAKVQRKMQRNKPLTVEENALIDGFMIKTSMSNGAGANVAQKVNPRGLKWQPITLKKGYTDTSQKVSEVGLKWARPTSSGKLHTRIWGDPHISEKAQKVSVYSPGTVRQLAYKVASS
jgi:hypothetical protein